MDNSQNLRILTYQESVDLVSRYGIPIAEGRIAKSPEEAAKIAKKIGFPVVLKVISPQITHKKDAEIIRTNIGTESELTKTYDEIVKNAKKYNPKAEIEGVLVQEMVQDGTEVIVGISKDPQFGPTILFGLGGVFVEILKDVSLRVCPISEFDADEMIRETKGYSVLEGFRGKRRSDIEVIRSILLKVSDLAVDLRDSILEMDINPLIVLEERKGAKAVDIRIVALK